MRPVLFGLHAANGPVPSGPRIATRTMLIALSLTASGIPAYGQTASPTAPVHVANAQEMRQRYVWSTLGAKGALTAVAFGAYDQWRQHPDGWEQDTDGFAKRVTASYARSAISDFTNYTVARTLHQDPSFTRCECSGVARRLWHGLKGPFVARNRDGKTLASPATITGIAVGHIVAATAWTPAPNSAAIVAGRAVASVALEMGMDVFREFRPIRAARADSSPGSGPAE